MQGSPGKHCVMYAQWVTRPSLVPVDIWFSIFHWPSILRMVPNPAVGVPELPVGVNARLTVPSGVTEPTN
jgi:hypothetical protein